MLRRTAILCVLAAQAFGAEAAVAATKLSATKKDRSATRGCWGARMAAVDEASRRKATRVVMCLVNRERRAHGKPVLRGSRSLARAALQHSAAMVGGRYFSHFNASGGVQRRAIRSGYARRPSQTSLGETLSWGAGPAANPARFVAMLMGSPPHRRTMLSRRFRDIGVGLALGAPTARTSGSAATLTLVLGRR